MSRPPAPRLPPLGKPEPPRIGSSTVLAVQAHLTDRDRTILDWLDRHDVLTTGQLTTALFGSPTTAAHRLAKLRVLGLVDRFHRPLPGGGFGPWHWVIGPLGAQLTAAARGEPAPTPAALRRRHARTADSSQLAHRLGTNEFFIRLHLHTRTHPQTRLLVWWSERETSRRFGRRIRPDGHALWAEHGQRVGMFLEYDTGTEDLARLSAKLDLYHELARDGGPAYPVLFWLPTPARETHLHRVLTDRHHDPTAVAVPVATGVHHPAADPAARVWWLAGERSATRRRLVELPSRDGTPEGVYNPHGTTALS